MHIFARMTKVDEAARTVTGVIANEALDRSGEVFDYESSKPLFEKWSTGIAKATDGKSVGNVRVMHSPAVAGVVKQLDMDDAAKAISVCAKIVDDNEWNKVLEGCYTGFSIGGSYARKWKGDDGLQRYTADPVEVSIVDLPCNPDAQFSVIKADGAEELRKFAAPAAEPLAKSAEAEEAEPAEVAPVEAAASAEPASVEPEIAKAAGADERGDLLKWSDALHELGKARSQLADSEAALAKVSGELSTANEALAKAVTERNEMADKLTKVSTDYAELLTKAAPVKGVAKVVPVDKDADAGHAAMNKLDESPVLRKDGSVDHAATALKLMKLAHRR